MKEREKKKKIEGRKGEGRIGCEEREIYIEPKKEISDNCELVVKP